MSMNDFISQYICTMEETTNSLNTELHIVTKKISRDTNLILDKPIKTIIIIDEINSSIKQSYHWYSINQLNWNKIKKELLMKIATGNGLYNQEI